MFELGHSGGIIVQFVPKKFSTKVEAKCNNESAKTN